MFHEEPGDIPYVDWLIRPAISAGMCGIAGWALWGWWWQISLVFFWAASLHAVRFLIVLAYLVLISKGK